MKINMICKNLNKKLKVIQYMKKGLSEKLYFYIYIRTSDGVCVSLNVMSKIYWSNNPKMICVIVRHNRFFGFVIKYDCHSIY